MPTFVYTWNNYREKSVENPEDSIVYMVAGALFSDCFSLIARIREGLPFESLERLEKQYRMTRKEFLVMIGINTSTINRRRIEGRMSVHEGEKIVRYARLLDSALGLMDGNNDSALRWLKTPARALGSQTPLSYASIELGAQQVEHLIGRIEHGVVI